jgi:hypothetical protein
VEVAYVAHSERCALLLDGEGVCRWVVPRVDAGDPSIGVAKRCVGAQFVASLDPEVEGLLGHQPRVGVTLLFACVDDGRVSLVRFGPLVGFDTLGDAVAPTAAMIDDVTVDKASDEIAESIAESIRESSPLTVRAPEPITAEPIVPVPIPEVVLEDLRADDLLLPKALEELAPPPPHQDGPPLEDLFGDLSEIETRVPRADDSEIEIVTGSFARVSDLAIAAFREDASSGDELENLAALRPSGFVMRASRPEDHPADMDQETCRFARVAGGEPEHVPDPRTELAAEPRRGILPRRFSRS